MRKPHFLIPLVLLALGTIASCKKEGDNQHIDPKDNQEFDFMTSKDSSYWRYGAADGVNYTRYARDKDTFVTSQGNTYRYYEHNAENGHPQGEFFVKNAGRFMTLIDLIGDGSEYLNYIFWKDGAKVGDQWTSTGEFNASGFGNVSALVETEAIEENMTITYGANTYNNVHHAHSDLKAGPLNSKVGTLDMYYSEGIGVIKQEIHVNILNTIVIDHTDSLIEYRVIN